MQALRGKGAAATRPSPKPFATTRVRRVVTKVAFTTAQELSVLSGKLRLLQAVSGLDRGRIANQRQRDEAATAIDLLERIYLSGEKTQSPAEITAALEGTWMLLWAEGGPVFTSSPFFWSFASGLVGNQDISNAIFAFTDSIPGAEVGAAYQRFEFTGPAGQGRLISEVDLTVWPGATGCVVTTSDVRLGVPPTQLIVTVQNTRVANSNLAGPLFDQVVVPVRELIEGVRGQGATSVNATLTFLDDELRITRVSPGNQCFVYKRVVV